MTINLKVRDLQASFAMLEVPKTKWSDGPSASEQADLATRRNQAQSDLIKASVTLKEESLPTWVPNLLDVKDSKSKTQERAWSPLLALENQNNFPEFFKNQAARENKDFLERKRIALAFSYAHYQFREPSEVLDSTQSRPESLPASNSEIDIASSRSMSPISTSESETDSSTSDSSEMNLSFDMDLLSGPQ